jgi:hypothetical protein
MILLANSMFGFNFHCFVAAESTPLFAEGLKNCLTGKNQKGK